MIEELNQRSQQIFRTLVETYLSGGAPVGSKTVAGQLPLNLSAASIRNVLKDLEHLGLLYAPHTSAGRVPTQAGLRMFVDAFLEVGRLGESERRDIEQMISGSGSGNKLEDVLSDAAASLSGLARCAGLVLSPKRDTPLKHVEFVHLGPGQALVVIVGQDGMIENRVITVPLGMTPSSMLMASNYLNSKLFGRTLEEARAGILAELDRKRGELDELTSKLVAAGLASWSGGSRSRGSTQGSALIVRGQANLLEDVHALADLERIRTLFEDLEDKNDLVQLLELARGGEGVRIFIGSENKLFSLSGSSLILAPYHNANEKVVGVLGVIGPTRLNYARIIPMVDYTAKMLGKLLS